MGEAIMPAQPLPAGFQLVQPPAAALPPGFQLVEPQVPQESPFMQPDITTQPASTSIGDIARGVTRGVKQLGVGGAQILSNSETAKDVIGSLYGLDMASLTPAQREQVNSELDFALQTKAESLKVQPETPNTNYFSAAVPELAGGVIGKGVKAGLALGAGIGATQPTAEGESRAVNTAVGGAGGALGAKIAPYIGGLANRAGKSISGLIGGKAATESVEASANAIKETLSGNAPSIQKALQLDAEGVANIDTQLLPKQVQELLKKPGFDKLTPVQKERLLNFEALGIKNYTLADVTRDYADATASRNLAQNANIGAPIRQADLAKNEQIIQAAQEALKKTQGQGGSDYDVGGSVYGAMKNQYDGFNNRITELYQKADEAAANAPKVPTNGVADELKGLRSEFLSSAQGKSLLNGIRARMQDFTTGNKAIGDKSQVLLVDADGLPLLTAADIPQKMTFTDSEKFRQFLNDVSTPENSRLVRKIKTAIDAAQDNAGGGDIYKEARSLRALRSKVFEDEAGLADVLAMKTGANQSIPFEEITKKYVYSSGSQKKLEQLTSFLGKAAESGDETADMALKNLRANVVQQAIDKATGNVPNEAGQSTFSGLNFKRALDKIGNDKLKILFTEEQRKYLGALSRGAVDLTTDPVVRNNFNASGTSAQIMNMLDTLQPPIAAKGNVVGGKVVDAALSTKIPFYGAIKELKNQGIERSIMANDAARASVMADPITGIVRSQEEVKKQAIANALRQYGSYGAVPGALGANNLVNNR
jgi:hypothetical protein